MQPTPSDVHVNTPLTNISIAYLQEADSFIADRVFPTVPVGKQSDRYYTYDRGFFNRDEAEERAPASESAGSGYEVDNTPNYFCPVYAWHHDIPDETRDNQDVVIDADRDATEICTHKMLIKREKLWTTKYFTSGIWTNDWAGVASGAGAGSSQVLQWNDATSTPIEDIRFGKRTVQESTAFRPNKLVLGREVYDTLLDHPDIVDRIKYGQTSPGPAIVNRMTLAALFELDEVLVMDSIENTAAEGATNSHSFIGGKKALLVYAAPRPGRMIPSGGYTFAWVGHMGAATTGQRILRFRIDLRKADRVECEMSFDQKLISADLGFFWDTIIA